MDGALNRMVNFTCTAVAQEIEWEVNGQPVDSALNSRGFDDSQKLIMLNETQNLRTRKLTVLASADNNNTNITCVAYFIVPVLSTTTSEPAVFLVFEPGMNKKHVASTALINTDVLKHLLDVAEDKMSCQVQNTLNYCGTKWHYCCMVTSASCLHAINYYALVYCCMCRRHNNSSQ